MKYEDLLELESSFDSCANELIYELTKSDRANYYVLSDLYRALSTQIHTQLEIVLATLESND